MANAVEGPENAGQPAVRPVLPIGAFRSTQPTYTDGQRVEPQYDSRGNQKASLYGGSSAPVGTRFASADGANLSSDLVLEVFAAAYGFNGATWDRIRTPVVFKHFASTAITAGTGATIWTPAAGKKFRLMGWVISSSAAGQLLFGDNLAATVIARSEAVAAAGVSNVNDGTGNGILSAAANNVLKLDGPTGNVAGMVWGVEE